MAHSATRALERADRGAPQVGFVRRALLGLTAVLLASGMIYYYEGVLLPIRIAATNPGGVVQGNWSDIYGQWLAARKVLLEHTSPYTPEVTYEIQRDFFGEAAVKSNQTGLGNYQAFAYPLYVVFLFAPFVHLSFASTRVVFTIIFFLLTIASVPLWIKALGFRWRFSTGLLCLVGLMSSYPVIDGLRLEQSSLLVAGFAAAGLAALYKQRLALAGALLAIATVKPQHLALLMVWLLIWTAGDWQTRKRLAISFAVVMAFFLAVSELLLPAWMISWYHAMIAYTGYVKPSLLQSVLPRTVAATVGGIAILLAVAFFVRARKSPQGSDGFNFAIVVALALTALLLPAAARAMYLQVLLFPAILWLFARGLNSAKGSGLARGLWVVAVMVLAGEWVFASAVTFAAVFLHHHFLQEASGFVVGPEVLVFFFPLSMMLFVIGLAPRMWQRA